MARLGEPDLKFSAIHLAKQNLIRKLQRLPEPGFDEKELADAIEEFFDAKIAAALDRRY